MLIIRRMGNVVNKAFWLRIDYGRHEEIIVTTAPSLQIALDRIQAAQRGRLAYRPQGPRIRRITALQPVTHDRAFNAFIDSALQLENS